MTQDHQKQTSKNIVRNVIFGSLTWILPVGLSFIATPVIVRSLGNSDYGIYALVLGFIGYSFAFSLGRAITKYIAEYRVSGESEKIRDVVAASFFLNIVIGLFGVIVICLLASWLVRDVFRIEPAAQNKTVIAMYVASGIIFLSMLNQVFSSVLQGIQRFDVYSKIFTANSLALISGNLLLAYVGFGLLALLYWNFLVLFFFSTVFAVAAKRLLPEFGIGLRFERETLGLVLRYSAGIVGYQILANLLLLFERGWIAQRLGTESLTYYVVPMSLGMYLHGFVSSLVLVIFPLASELKDDKNKLLKIYTKATKVVSLLVVFVLTNVVINGKLFLLLWMGPGFEQNSSNLLILHFITFGLVSILTVSWQMTEGLGFPQYNVAIFAVCLVVCIALMFVLTGDYGNLGVAAARSAGFTTIFFSIFVVEKCFFKNIQTRFWLGLVGNLALAALGAALIESIVIALLPANWPTFLFSVFVGGLAYCFVLWLLDFVTADERLLIKRVFSQ